MAQRYQIVSTADSAPLDSQALAPFLAKDGPLLLPLVDLIEQAQTAVDDVVDVMGRATSEATLAMNAQERAGPKQPGQAAPRDVVSGARYSAAATTKCGMWLGHLPQDQHEQAKLTLRAAFKLEADEGQARLQQYASWIEREWPSAAGSLREGLEELFTIDRLGLPARLRRRPGTTNVIDNSHGAPPSRGQQGAESRSPPTCGTAAVEVAVILRPRTCLGCGRSHSSYPRQKEKRRAAAVPAADRTR